MRLLPAPTEFDPAMKGLTLQPVLDIVAYLLRLYSCLVHLRSLPYEPTSVGVRLSIMYVRIKLLARTALLRMAQLVRTNTKGLHQRSVAGAHAK